ncbi:MAG: tyrosine-type recombinase/integrase [Gemmatimonadota bacterium]
MKAKLWSHTAGQRPNRVRVFERSPGGTLYARVWDARRSAYRKVSLGHQDKARAKVYAAQQYAKLVSGRSEIQQGRTTLARLLRLYREHRTPRKAQTEQQADSRRIEMFLRFLGTDTDAHMIPLRVWESFIDLRGSGGIDPRGCLVPEDQRRAVRARTVESDLQWLKWVLNWGKDWRLESGIYLLRENCVRGYPIPSEKNPRRAVATQDRYEAVRAVSDQVTMEIRWQGRRETQRSYLSEIFDVAAGTGRRLSAVLGLRSDDLQLTEGPFGSIRWRSDTDKTGRESVVPIGPDVRAAIDRRMADRPVVGAALLFPSPTDPAAPADRHLADAWLRKAEALAGIATQKGSLWHAYRRAWATARKHLPAIDVAAAGGWKGVETLQAVYQQADTDTMLRVVLEAGEVREVR